MNETAEGDKNIRFERLIIVYILFYSYFFLHLRSLLNYKLQLMDCVFEFEMLDKTRKRACYIYMILSFNTFVHFFRLNFDYILCLYNILWSMGNFPVVFFKFISFTRWNVLYLSEINDHCLTKKFNLVHIFFFLFTVDI